MLEVHSLSLVALGLAHLEGMSKMSSVVSPGLFLFVRLLLQNNRAE
jgi:hypothetical protein